MDILRQKRLTVRLCAVISDDEVDESWIEPAYAFDIAGAKYALEFRTDDKGAYWVVIDLQYGVQFNREFRTFNDAAEGLKDETWLTEEHNKLADAGTEEVEQPDVVFYTVDNPLKGIPGIALLPRYVPPRSTTDDTETISDEDAELTIQEIMKEADYDDDDSDEAQLSVKADNDDTKIGWEELINRQMSEDDETEEDETAEIDDEIDLEGFTDSLYKRMTFKVEPTAAFVSRIGTHRVAFRILTGFDHYAVWQAFDITIGLVLWESVSLAELMRIAPLMVPVVTEMEMPETLERLSDLPLDTVLYLNGLAEAFEGNDRDVKQYLDTGYLKMVGQQYIQLMDRMFLDPGSPRSEKHWQKWHEDTDDASDED